MSPLVEDAPVKITAPQTNAVPDRQSGLLSDQSASAEWSPQSVLASLPEHSQFPTGLSTPVPFFHLLARLKTTKREGWRRFGIDRGESIADHMYRMAIITMTAPRSLTSRLDMARCTRLALVHDIAESLVGDITPVDGVAKSEKHRREAATMDYICNDLLGKVDNGAQGAEFQRAWQEYEDGKTPEAQFVKDVDKLELVLQMVEYEKQAEGRLDLGEFSWVASRIVLAESREWCAEVLAERRRYWAAKGQQVEGDLGEDYLEKGPDHGQSRDR